MVEYQEAAIPVVFLAANLPLAAEYLMIVVIPDSNVKNLALVLVRLKDVKAAAKQIFQIIPQFVALFPPAVLSNLLLTNHRRINNLSPVLPPHWIRWTRTAS